MVVYPKQFVNPDCIVRNLMSLPIITFSRAALDASLALMH